MSVWSPYSIDEVSRLFAAMPAPWWIAGGHAIDLFVGHATRSHDDIDVQILRGAEQTFAERLAGWELHTAKAGQLTPWTPRDRADAIWCRPADRSTWALELVVADIVDDRWVYRRDPRISRPVREIGDRTAGGVPFLRPEIQLLYKSKAMRPKDEADLRAVLPRLDDGARAWLREALGPPHPWSACL